MNRLISRAISSAKSTMARAGPIQQSIERKIHAALKPSSFTIQNDSAKHAGHREGSKDPNAETHFNVSIESSAFEGKSLVQQHRMVYDLLAEEFQQGLHALALKTKST